MANLQLLPNEAILLKDVAVAHGGVMAAFTDDLVLTNINIICVSKGIFGNQKKTYIFPLNQIKIFNGKPQAIAGKLSNGYPCLEIYFINGMETFYFQNKKYIDKWIDAITKALCGNSIDIDNTETEKDDSLADEIHDMKEEFKAMGQELMGAFGFKSKNASHPKNSGDDRISKKCTSCSAPLIGKKGQIVRCKYCDTDQTL